MSDILRLLRNNWLLVTIMLLAIGLRLPYLNGSLWLDEAAQALESARPFNQQLDIIPDFQPPLIHFIAHFSLYFSSSEWWLRTTTALIPGLLTIILAYGIGVRIGGKSVGLWTALLLATSSFHIFYSQELRPYSLPALFAVLSWWLLIRQDAESQSQRSQWLWVGFCISTILGLYSSYLYPFLVLSQLVWLVGWRKDQVKFGLMAMVIAGVAFVPWLPHFSQQLAAGGEVRVQLPGWSEAVSTPQLKALPLVAGKFTYGVMNIGAQPWFIATALGLTVIACVLLYQWWQSTRKKPQQRTYVWLTLVWLVVPLVTAWIISWWIPVVQPKRVLYLLPAAYLAVSLMASQVKTRWIGSAAVAFILILNSISIAAYYTNASLQRENWRELHQQILKNYPADRSVAVFVFPGPFAPWDWYDDGTYPTLSTGTLHIDDVPSMRETLKPLNDYQFILVFDYLRDLTDPNDQILREIEAFGFRSVELIDYPNIGFVRVYARPEAVMGSNPHSDLYARRN